MYGGSSGTFTMGPEKTKTVKATTTGITTTAGDLKFVFSKFTIDGNYFLSGKFTITSAAAANSSTVEGF